MIIVNSGFEHKLKLEENKIIRIVIENPVCLRRYLAELTSSIEDDEGPFVLSENNVPIHMKDKAMLIRDPLLLDFEQKPFQTKLTNRIRHIITGPDVVEPMAALRQSLLVLSDIIADGIDVPLSSFDDVDISSLLKMISFHIDVADEPEIMQLFDFLRIARELCGIKIFFIENAQLFFTSEELRTFADTCFGEKIHLIFLEAHNRGRFTDEEQLIIIDNDLCEIF